MMAWGETKARFEMLLTPLGKDSRVKLDGEDISHKVREFEVHASVNEVTTVSLEYVCSKEPVKLEGEATVVHHCPINGILALAYDRDTETAEWLPMGETFIDRGGVRRRAVDHGEPSGR